VAQLNRLFAEADWPLLPEGVSERVRLDTVRLCPSDEDCSPAEEHGRGDGARGHPTPEAWYVQEVLAPGQPDWALLHEWGHQLGPIDLYMIAFSPPFNHVPDRAGAPWLVATHTRQWNSLMSNVTPLLDEHTAYALNRNNGILFITLLARGQEEHLWLDITELNLAFWRGQTGLAVLDVPTHIPPDGAPLPDPPANLRVKTVGRINTLTWEGEEGLSYHVYRGWHPGFVWQRVVTGTVDTSFSEDISPYLEWTGAIRYAVSAMDAAGRESAFAVAHGAALVRPEGIALGPSGQRWILDNHYGEAFLQRPDGEILGVTTFTDEGSGGRHDVAVDPQGYAYLQAADSGSVHLFDPAGHVLGALTTGLTGTYGLAYLGEGYTTATDVTVLPVLDDRTGLLVYFEGTVNGEDDEIGIPSGVSFTSGYHGQGALLAGTASLAYPVADNIQAGQGAVEMWLQPKRSSLSHPAFVDLRGLAASSTGRLYVADAGANLIHVLQFAPETESLDYLGSLGEGQLQTPNDVTLDGGGRLVVADSGHARLALWDEEGNLLGSRTLPDPPYDDTPLLNPRAVAWAGDGLVVSDGEDWSARVVHVRSAGWFREITEGHHRLRRRSKA